MGGKALSSLSKSVNLISDDFMGLVDSFGSSRIKHEASCNCLMLFVILRVRKAVYPRYAHSLTTYQSNYYSDSVSLQSDPRCAHPIWCKTQRWQPLKRSAQGFLTGLH